MSATPEVAEMGSKFMDLFVLDPLALRAQVQGEDEAALLRQLDEPEASALAPAFTLMGEGLFCFLAKGRERADGLMYCRAVERLMQAMAHDRWCVEFYPDEGLYPLWSLAFRACEAPWLALPETPYGVGDVRWRSPDTCLMLSRSVGGLLHGGDYDRDFISEADLRVTLEALDAGWRSKHGVFAIYQA
ncbi:MAG: hypothetical protein H6740_16355 [Alphaproteobacteria bacterium]|nr:hypothetical protein [Alphaproteobacteria bacterium]